MKTTTKIEFSAEELKLLIKDSLTADLLEVPDDNIKIDYSCSVDSENNWTVTATVTVLQERK